MSRQEKERATRRKKDRNSKRKKELAFFRPLAKERKMSKVLLTAAPAEMEAYADFLEDITQNNPFQNITIIACKDILNFIPEIGDPKRMRVRILYPSLSPLSPTQKRLIIML